MSEPADVDAAVETTRDGSVRIALRVIPRSPRTTFDGVRNGRILLRVTAPPVDRAANEAVIAAVAELIGVPKRAVRIVSGDTARDKTVEIAGVDGARVRERLGEG